MRVERVWPSRDWERSADRLPWDAASSGAVVLFLE